MPLVAFDNDDWVIGAVRCRSPNTDGSRIQPDLVVLHYTAASSAASTIDWFASPKAEVSAHFLIDRDGTLFQFLPATTKAWHAGKDSKFGGRPRCNEFSIGIEFVNPGPLTLVGAWAQDSNRRAWRHDYVMIPHRNPSFGSGPWATFPQDQLAKGIDLVAALCLRYRIKAVCGHDEVTTRKADPGPAFPMALFRPLARDNVNPPPLPGV